MQSNNIYGDLAQLLKVFTRQTIESTQPMNFTFGKVINTNPLQISIDQKLILGDEFLILTNAVRDHSVDIEISWNTDKPDDGNNSDPTKEHTHKHKIHGRKKITIYNGLTPGEKVLLLRAQGGQDYIVIDRVDEIPTKGESL